MTLATCKGTEVSCCLCRWQRAYELPHDAELLVRNHLWEFHGRLLVTTQDVTRKGKRLLSWAGPRWQNDSER